MEIKVWTDGSHNLHNDKCAWAYVIKYDADQLYHEDSEMITKGKLSTNIAEMTAPTKALQFLNAAFADKESRKKFDIVVTSDSQYVVKGIMEWIHSWRISNFSTRKNYREWKLLYDLVYKSGWNSVKFEWVRGHTGMIENERCDYLCSSKTTTKPQTFIKKGKDTEAAWLFD